MLIIVLDNHQLLRLAHSEVGDCRSSVVRNIGRLKSLGSFLFLKKKKKNKFFLIFYELIFETKSVIKDGLYTKYTYLRVHNSLAT